MAIKEILVHLDATERCQVRVDVAVSLARRFRAHLTGVYATSHPFSAGRRADAPPLVDRLEQSFRGQAKAAGVVGDWVNADSEGLVAGVVERLIQQAYFSDLTIIGQADPGAASHSTPEALPERLVAASGRPVLVIPRAGSFTQVGSNILLAWRGGLASARALNDAMPLLEGAEQASLLMVNPGEQFAWQADRLDRYLSYHGVTASIDKLTAEDLQVGDVLLNQACDLGADLVVMGVLPQRRLGRTSLGPVGRQVLDAMTLPVLMSR